MRDEVVNFSLNYRHISENNLENYRVLLILHLKIAERRGIRILVYEHDNIKELGSRVMTYLYQHSSALMPNEYSDYLQQALILFIENQLIEYGIISP